MRQSNSEEWDLARWKRAMEARGSVEEEEAYRRLAQYLLLVAYKLLGSCTSLINREVTQSVDDMAREFVQETLLRVHQSYSRFRWHSHITTYATSILQHNILEAARMARVREIASDFQEPAGEDEPLDPVAAYIQAKAARESDTPEKVLEQKEAGRALVQALDSLSELQRKVVILFYVEQYTVSELASALGTSIDAVHKNLSRARQQLFQVLRDLNRSEGMEPDHG